VAGKNSFSKLNSRGASITRQPTITVGSLSRSVLDELLATLVS
jgi:hypothetical protein